MADDASQSRPSPAAAPGAAPGKGQPTAWYVARPSGRRDGPMSLEMLKQYVSAGSVAPEHLVWREGMPGWTPAGSVPELFGTRTGQTPPSLPEPEPRGADWSENLKQLDPMLSNPSFFRIFGRVCAALAVLLIVVSIMLGWILRIHFFTEATVLALIFLVGEAAAVLMDRLGRIHAAIVDRDDSSASKTFR